MIRLRRLDQETARELEVGFDGGPLVFSPDGRFLLIADGDGISRVPVEGGSAIPVAEDDAVFGADWSEDNRIVFVGLRGMYIVPSTGGEPNLLLEAGTFTTWDPRFLPGGRHVVYTHGSLGQARGEIRILDLETRDTRVVIEDGFAPQYVNTGHLLFARGDQSLFAASFDVKTAEVTGPPQQVMDSVTVNPFAPLALYQVSEAGTAVFGRGTPLAQDATRYTLVDSSGVEEFLPVPPGQLNAGQLSPDGRLLAYQRDIRVYVYDRLLGRNTPLTPEGSIAASPLWSRDGTQIAYFSLGVGEATVFTIPADGSRAPRALVDPGAFGEESFGPLSWGPDDASVLVQTDILSGDANSDLGILYLGSDTTLVPYLRADWHERNGAISPDGRWVAYLSDEIEEFRLYVRSFPEPGDRHDVSPAGQVVWNKPLWARDGSALYWRTEGAPSWRPA